VFPRAQRLQTTQDILTVLRKGTRRSTGVVACSFYAKPGSLSKITVIVDSKVAKNATMRNLLKRRVRAFLRSITLPEGDLVIRLHKGAPELSYSELISQIQKCLNQLPRPSRNSLS